MKSSRFSQNGSAVRGLIIAMAVVSLVWIVYLLALPAALQPNETLIFFAALAGMALVLLIVWLLQPKEKVTDTFWLCHDGESTPTGPFTLAQVVTMWRMGQITTRGKVMAEGGEIWQPIMTFADQFDGSIGSAEKKPSGCRTVFLALGICFIAVLCIGTCGSEERKRARIRQENLREVMEHLQEQAEKESQLQTRKPTPSPLPSTPPAALFGN